METINDRMEMVVNEQFDGNKAAFAKAIAVEPATLSSYLGKQRRSKPSVDMVSKIVLRLGVDARWLLTGEAAGQARPRVNAGGMSGGIVSVADGGGISAVNSTVNAEEGGPAAAEVPIVPEGVSEQPDTDVYKLVKDNGIAGAERLNAIGRHVRLDMYWRVREDAMMPKFMRGDILALAHLSEGAVFPNGSPMVVDTQPFGFVFRRVYDAGDALDCRVANKESGYTDTVMPKSQVIRLYRVVGLLRIGN